MHHSERFVAIATMIHFRVGGSAVKDIAEHVFGIAITQLNIAVAYLKYMRYLFQSIEMENYILLFVIMTMKILLLKKAWKQRCRHRAVVKESVRSDQFQILQNQKNCL